ncbi:MAG: hypothetical protein KAS11_03235 [Candidatus Aenigmarchaeota archaeon]|nr:hypothetical protein [Candidatus Aenigmarchaeota archaeon]
MLEIVLLFAVFCVGVVGIGFLSTRDIYKQITETVANMKRSGNREARGVRVSESRDVDTAAINPDTGDLLVNLNDIEKESYGAGQAIYNSIRDDAKLLREIGLDKAQTYKDFVYKVKDSVVDSTVTHEIGHVWSKADEVGAELYRSAVKGYGKLTAKDKLDYVVSLRNLITYGGEKGYNTALDVFETLKDTYGYAAFVIGTIVNKALDSADKKVVYGEKKHTVDLDD